MLHGSPLAPTYELKDGVHNIVVEPATYGLGLWLVRDANQLSGSVFSAPVKACVTSREAAERIAEEYRAAS